MPNSRAVSRAMLNHKYDMAVNRADQMPNAGVMGGYVHRPMEHMNVMNQSYHPSMQLNRSIGSGRMRRRHSMDSVEGAGFFDDFKRGFDSVIKPVASIAKPILSVAGGPYGKIASVGLDALGYGKHKPGRPRKVGRPRGSGGATGAGFFDDFKRGFDSVMKPVASIAKPILSVAGGPYGKIASVGLNALGYGKRKPGRPRKVGRPRGSGGVTGAGSYAGEGGVTGAGGILDLVGPLLGMLGGRGKGKGKNPKSARKPSQWNMLVQKVMSQHNCNMRDAIHYIKSNNM